MISLWCSSEWPCRSQAVHRFTLPGFPLKTIFFLCPFKIHFNIGKGGRKSVWALAGAGGPRGGTDSFAHIISFKLHSHPRRWIWLHLLFTGKKELAASLESNPVSEHTGSWSHIKSKLPHPISTVNIHWQLRTVNLDQVVTLPCTY